MLKVSIILHFDMTTFLCITLSFHMHFWQAICVPHLTLKSRPNVAAGRAFI